MEDLVNISIGDAGTTAILGYAVVFLALVLLMVVVMITSSIMSAGQKKKAAAAAAAAPAVDDAGTRAAAAAPTAPGSAGELKLYDTDPRTAATLMAIVADELQTPVNELRFQSIREIKEEK